MPQDDITVYASVHRADEPKGHSPLVMTVYVDVPESVVAKGLEKVGITQAALDTLPLNSKKHLAMLGKASALSEGVCGALADHLSETWGYSAQVVQDGKCLSRGNIKPTQYLFSFTEDECPGLIGHLVKQMRDAGVADQEVDRGIPVLSIQEGIKLRAVERHGQGFPASYARFEAGLKNAILGGLGLPPQPVAPSARSRR